MRSLKLTQPGPRPLEAVAVGSWVTDSAQGNTDSGITEEEGDCGAFDSLDPWSSFVKASVSIEVLSSDVIIAPLSGSVVARCEDGEGGEEGGAGPKPCTRIHR